MVIHYSASPENAACGRTGSSLATTPDASRVSCKLCLRTVEKKANEPVRKTPSLADLRAAAKAAKAPAAPTPGKPTPARTARTEWQRRLEQLPGRNRLPRGASRQSFI
ncbi:hypothetical protein [Stutzerimonas stutzeri]|uniref:hypothetical protein n=1 Tax=Stutzerimonas stutzeri TaxID=316 RepID=UPI001E2F16DE|nr:hypothetical protein [Stutzerimonas stutzeri]